MRRCLSVCWQIFRHRLAELDSGPVTNDRVFQWLEAIVRQHHANPNLARLLQHAALSGGPHTNELIDRLFRPMFQSGAKIEGADISLFENSGLQPWAVMAFNNSGDVVRYDGANVPRLAWRGPVQRQSAGEPA